MILTSAVNCSFESVLVQNPYFILFFIVEFIVETLENNSMYYEICIVLTLQGHLIQIYPTSDNFLIGLGT